MNMNYEITPAYRTLCQCTFGPRESDIKDFQDQATISNWIDFQVDKNRSSWLNLFTIDQNKDADLAKADGLAYATSWTRMMIERDDILRQRIAYTLTQLFVVSNKDPALAPVRFRKGFCNYYDGLSERAFGNLRALLMFVSTSPVMGAYLTFTDNESNEDTSADENYARELLQLFTLGPVELRNDGSVVTDNQGNPKPSYTQKDIEELAKVFTGWQFASSDLDEQYMKPMVNTGNHNKDLKIILDEEFPADNGAVTELTEVIEHLMSQSNIYTYISYFFISKLVTSNPPKDYVERVQTAFRNSDGEMLTLIKAILTDDAALKTSNDAGKVRDPLVVFYHAMRALNVRRTAGTEVWGTAFKGNDRLLPMQAPSVFYYYQCDDSPATPEFDDLNAPEFNVYQWSDIYQYGDEVKGLIAQFHDQNRGWGMKPKWINNFVNKRDTTLIEDFDLELFGGRMREDTKTACLAFLEECPRVNPTYYGDIRALIMNLIISPEFIVQR